MSFSQETKRRMTAFAKEQSQYYLEDAEMTYLERLRKKGGQARNKAAGKLARFRPSSGKRLEAQDDMVLYISDFMEDRMAAGIPEEEALEQAMKELAYTGGGPAAGLQERYRQYYEDQDPATYEAIGLYYGASMLLCTVAGGVGGALLGVLALDAALWIPIAVGAGAGAVTGTAFGMIKHASIVRGGK